MRGIARKYQISPAQATLAWCLRQPVLAIPKASSIAHVEENAASEPLGLDPQDLAEIDRAYPVPHRKQSLDML
jgi:diketogulonate reductase-like aldo/keto reductase